MSFNHPAKYTDKFIVIFTKLLKDCQRVYDPMAGTGKLGLIKQHGFCGEIYCCEIEPEWINQYPGVDYWFVADCSNTPFLKSNFFDAICTSPTYGNRMADHFNATDSSKRITYRHKLGRILHERNTGRMQWGEKYRQTHKEIYKECLRILKNEGIFILNISDHIRKGEVMPVVNWHRDILLDMGMKLFEDIKADTQRMRFGANNKLRVNHERILVFQKVK